MQEDRGITVAESDADFVDSQQSHQGGLFGPGGRDNPYQIFLTTQMRLSGQDKLLGKDMPLDGQLIYKYTPQ